MAAKRIKVVYKKLLRNKAIGLSDGSGTIEVDERVKGRQLMEIIIHECLHELFPELEEEEIINKSIVISKTLWHEGFRRMDNNTKDELYVS
jgi:hypothetical protein